MSRNNVITKGERKIQKQIESARFFCKNLKHRTRREKRTNVGVERKPQHLKNTNAVQTITHTREINICLSSLALEFTLAKPNTKKYTNWSENNEIRRKFGHTQIVPNV